jgi:CRP/FNR family transcriptional regulator, anaerobic regulatory protein
MKQIQATAALVDEFPILTHLEQELLERLTQTAMWRRYDAHEDVQNHEQTCDGLMKVKQGKLRVYMQDDQGKEITLYRLFPGDSCVMTASCLLHQLNVDFLIEAEVETIVILLPTTYLSYAAQRYPALSEHLNELVRERFGELTWVIRQIVFSSMPARIAELLVNRSVGRTDTTLALSHEEIANDLGSAREVVSRILKYFQEEGLIEQSRKRIRLTDIDGLKSKYLD